MRKRDLRPGPAGRAPEALSDEAAPVEIIVDSVRSGVPGEYMGRTMPRRQGSVLGNPFKITKEWARAESLERYREWLRERMADARSTQLIELDRLERILKRDGRLVLLCWCRTAGETEPACHCDVIAEVILERAEEMTRAPENAKTPPPPKG